jgi:hypothetical protein
METPEPLIDNARDECAPGEISDVEQTIADLWEKWKRDVPFLSQQSQRKGIVFATYPNGISAGRNLLEWFAHY